MRKSQFFKFWIVIFVLVCLGIFFQACNKKGEDEKSLLLLYAFLSLNQGGGDSILTNANVNLLTSNSLAIVKDSTSANLLEGRNLQKNSISSLAGKLYAFGADNSSTRVSLTKNGSELVYGLYNTNKFIIIYATGIKSLSGASCINLLLRKSDSALFCIDNLGSPPECGQGGGCYYKEVQADSTGNIMYLSSYSSGLYRIDATNPTNITSTEIVNRQSGGRISHLAVNGNGDAFVSVSFSSSTINRVYKKAGGFFNVNASGASDCMTNGIGGIIDNFYFLDNSVNPGKVEAVISTSGNFSTGIYGNYSGHSGNESCFGGGNIVKTSNKVFMGFKPRAGHNKFLEAVNETSTPVLRTVSSLNSIDILHGSNDAIYLLGKDALGNSGIVKYTVSSNTFSTILNPGDYTISKMDVSSSGDITFFGLRASDGANIIGTIVNGTNIVTILSTQFSEVFSLSRIN